MSPYSMIEQNVRLEGHVVSKLHGLRKKLAAIKDFPELSLSGAIDLLLQHGGPATILAEEQEQFRRKYAAPPVYDDSLV